MPHFRAHFGSAELPPPVNGVYTQAFNQRHALVGRLFQGRFKAILVDRAIPPRHPSPSR